MTESKIEMNLHSELAEMQARAQFLTTEQQKSILYGFALGLAAGSALPPVTIQTNDKPRKEEAQ